MQIWHCICILPPHNWTKEHWMQMCMDEIRKSKTVLTHRNTPTHWEMYKYTCSKLITANVKQHWHIITKADNVNQCHYSCHRKPQVSSHWYSRHHHAPYPSSWRQGSMFLALSGWPLVVAFDNRTVRSNFKVVLWPLTGIYCLKDGFVPS